MARATGRNREGVKVRSGGVQWQWWSAVAVSKQALACCSAGWGCSHV